MAEGTVHRRFNPLLEEWVIVSPHRLLRPWQGAQEPSNKPKETSELNPLSNPLCPGAMRPNGQHNPDYESTFVFPNDFPALLSDLPKGPDKLGSDQRNTGDNEELFRCESIRGECRVMCFHPKSTVQLATMSLDEIGRVISVWCDQLRELGQKWDWVQVFENKGAIVGCSNPHPHCQIWCTDYLPTQIARKDATQRKYYAKHAASMLLDYANKELINRKRIVVENSDWLVVVPYWAMWPFVTLLLPKRHITRLVDVSDTERASLASIMKNLLIKYDNLFQCSFPYSMGFHQAPFGQYLSQDMNHWQLHAVYLPPLLRSSTVKKFIAGFELLCEPQRDLTAEMAAERLRSVSGDVRQF